MGNEFTLLKVKIEKRVGVSGFMTAARGVSISSSKNK